MADLASIKARIEILNEKLTIDLTSFGGNKIEFILSTEKVEEVREIERLNQKEFIKLIKEKIEEKNGEIKMNDHLNFLEFMRLYSQVELEKLTQDKIVKFHELYLNTFDLGLKLEDLQLELNTSSPQFGKQMYIDFLKTCYDEFFEKYRQLMGK